MKRRLLHSSSNKSSPKSSSTMLKNFQVLLTLLICAAIGAVADDYNATISVLRDTSDSLYDGVPIGFGCVYLSKKDNGFHVAAVDGHAAPGSSKCAKLRVHSEFSEGKLQYQFQEISTGKYLINDGDWIYFFGDKGSNQDVITFRTEPVYLQPKLYQTSKVYYTLRPLSAAKPMWALYDYGDLNVKKDGFRVFVYIVRY